MGNSDFGVWSFSTPSTLLQSFQPELELRRLELQISAAVLDSTNGEYVVLAFLPIRHVSFGNLAEDVPVNAIPVEVIQVPSNFNTSAQPHYVSSLPLTL
ncbi:hypothetical protein BV898_15682 [Hypsibius exemplaris]|uniref:Uncharacterized protein n=1 Tax=Hypsibius exemplaris TaxID=2072580 RepID=A0A9X6NKM2_HYPEX|nr:hypothetical protein BV898_15682 [Hypsibius exemplaris]